MLDYKDIITKHYALGMSGIAMAKLPYKSFNISGRWRRPHAQSLKQELSSSSVE